MSVAISALLQVMFIILLGYLIRRLMRFSDSFWDELAKLTYFLLTPALLIYSLSNKPLDDLPWFSIASVLVVVLLTCSVLLIVWQRYVRSVDPASFTSIFQGGVRFNSFVALAIVYNLFGESGIVAAAISMSVIIITVNVLCLLVFSFYGQEVKSWKSIFISLSRNPLILGCVIGLTINLSPLSLPDEINVTLGLLGKCALPLALLAIGAALKTDRNESFKEMVIVASVMQLLIKPAMTFVFALSLGLEGMILAIITIMMAVPTAPSAYILAKQLGGNSTAMASIIANQTFLAIFTLPVTFYILSTYG